MRRLLFLLLLLPAFALAARLDYAGVLGNSGVSGATLVHADVSLKAQDGGGLTSGVYLDRDMCVWLSGGDAVNRLTFDGRLVHRFPLDPPGSRIDSTAFAVLDGVLYALGHSPKKVGERVVLFALPMDGAATGKIVMEGFPTYRGALCPTPWQGKLLFGYALDDNTVHVETFDPKTAKRAPLFTLPGSEMSGLAIDPDGPSLLVGGYFGKYVGADMHQPYVHEIMKVDWNGKILWRKECLETPANPTQFRGVVSYAGGALWDTAWYGFFARLDRTGVSAPGKIMSWDVRAPFVSQVLDVHQGTALLPPAGVGEAFDPLLLAMHLPDQAYLAAWDADAQEITLQQRYGSLPELDNVYLSPDGWVFTGAHWWRFDDAPNAAPAYANFVSAPMTPGAFHGDWVCMLRADKQASVPCVARPALGRESAQYAWGHTAPFTQARGFAVSNPAAPVVWGYASDAATHRLWRARMYLLDWVPQGDSWKPLTIDGDAPANPGDVAVLPDGGLVVADGDAVVWLQPAGQAWHVARRLTAWGDAPDQHFGAHLRLAADGNNLLVSDTDRQRVVLLDATTGRPTWRYGSTDVAGAGDGQLNAPGAVAIAGNRAIVADTGNQRVVKFTLADAAAPRIQAWSTRKPAVKDGKLVDWVPGPEFLAWRDAVARDGFTGKVLGVKLTGPFVTGALSQHAGALLLLEQPIPPYLPFTLTFKARSLTGSRNLSVHRSWGGSVPWDTITITPEWQDYVVPRVADHATEIITFSLAPKQGALQDYCAGTFELTDVQVTLAP